MNEHVKVATLRVHVVRQRQDMSLIFGNKMYIVSVSREYKFDLGGSFECGSQAVGCA